MPEPISSNNGAASAALCDPNNACCELSEVFTAPPGAPAKPNGPPPPAEPRVVTIPPVYITGDASEQLTKHYGERAAAACRNERNAAIAACPNIGAAVLESGPLTAHVASLVCAQLITAYDNCKDVVETRLKIADFCEAQDKKAWPGVRPDEILCYKLPE